MESFDKEKEDITQADGLAESADALDVALTDDGETDGNPAEETAENTEISVAGAIENSEGTENAVEETGEIPAEMPKNDVLPERKNKEQMLEGYVSFAGGKSGGAGFKDNVKKLAPVWRFAALAMLLLIVAFSGAFAGVYYVCSSAVYKESDFFDAFIAKWSGVIENRVEVDVVSGEYKGDAIDLAQKALSTTVLVRVGARNKNGTFIESDSGSGVIYAHPDGTDTYYVVTNHHVVYNSKELLVEIYDESVSDKRDNRFLATIKYLDETSDLAVLEFECERELTVATQADSSKAKAGQSVIAAGNPLGHGFAVSLGYVSNPLRITAANNNVPLIVVDISVNPGNSGGGLYDTAGNLLGIVTSKASGSDVDGIGYAVPSNTVNDIVNDLLTYGYVRDRAAIGATVVGIFNPTTYFEYEGGELNGCIFNTEMRHYGVYVTESSNDLLQKGDRIVSIDGEEITATVDIQRIMLKKKPNNVVRIVLESAEKAQGASEPTYSVRTVTVLLVERTFSDPVSDQEKNEV